MRPLILAALILAPIAAHAAEPTPAPRMVTLPANLAEYARQYVAQYKDRTASEIAGALAACLSSNEGQPWKPDGCPTVTAALKAQREAQKLVAHPMPVPQTSPAAP